MPHIDTTFPSLLTSPCLKSRTALNRTSPRDVLLLSHILDRIHFECPLDSPRIGHPYHRTSPQSDGFCKRGDGRAFMQPNSFPDTEQVLKAPGLSGSGGFIGHPPDLGTVNCTLCNSRFPTVKLCESLSVTAFFVGTILP
jgi:hypothetical protein